MSPGEMRKTSLGYSLGMSAKPSIILSAWYVPSFVDGADK